MEGEYLIMKKRLGSILAVVLCVAMAFTFAGCGSSDKKAVVGSWNTKVDISGAFVSGLTEGLGEAADTMPRPAAEYFSNVTLSMDLTLNGDGSFVMAPAQGWKDELADSLTFPMQIFLQDFMVAYLSSYLLDIGVTQDISTPDALDVFLQDTIGMNLTEMTERTLGTDLASFLRGTVDEIDIDDSSTVTGVYELVPKEGKILFAPDKASLSKSVYDLYQLDGDTLTLAAGSGSALILFQDEDVSVMALPRQLPFSRIA